MPTLDVFGVEDNKTVERFGFGTGSIISRCPEETLLISVISH